jgi:hypothetical protein
VWVGQKTRVVKAEDCGGGVTKVRSWSHFDVGEVTAQEK